MILCVIQSALLHGNRPSQLLGTVVRRDAENVLGKTVLLDRDVVMVEGGGGDQAEIGESLVIIQDRP